ncbi:MAG: site-specific DNA-methyltransferase [Chitinispirillaceae bacterium]|nr:site-specific DNA-methyltransferase [Chitinispirillaceae bacterium]
MGVVITNHMLPVQGARDCSSIADASVHLVVTSPPYPMIGMWDGLFRGLSADVAPALEGGDGMAAFEAMHRELDKVWSHMYRVLSPGGFLCINIGDATRTVGDTFRLYPNHTRITSFCTSLGFDALPMIHWWKPTNAPNKFMGSGMLPAGAYVTLEHEYILLFRKGGKREFASAELKKNRLRSAYFWEERNQWFSDTWDLKGLRQDLGADAALRQRSAAYPFELAWRLICMYSVQGDTVLDPFLGTGTTTLAAIAACRNSIGVEIDATLGQQAGASILASGNGLNEMIIARLRKHDDFVRERVIAGKALKHVNDWLESPVMTGQETAIVMPLIDRIEQVGPGQLRVIYAPVAASGASKRQSQ